MDSQEIRRLIYQGYEVTACDYKRDIPWDKEHQTWLTKGIIAFANTGGSDTSIGTDEEQPSVEHRPTGVFMKQQEYLGRSGSLPIDKFSALC